MLLFTIFSPLISFLVAGLFGRYLGDRLTHIITCTLLVLSAAGGAMIFYYVALLGHAHTIELLPWIVSENLNFSWSLKLDTLSAVMIFVVTAVSACVHLYSVGYMHEDDSQPRFMAYLGLFTFMMLMLVTADNLVQMFFGWEGVGLASYLLIGFWYKKPEANAAAIKAFVVNRVGDFGYSLGIFGCFALFGSVMLDDIFASSAAMSQVYLTFLGYQVHAISLIALLLFIGAMGKSAQLGLHTWLPDAMEGPTPVSALIHAATMVTAGVFMVARMSPLFEFAPGILDLITIVGASTAFFAATVALTQNDIKRVIAYSTCSQLGYMFFAIGVSAYGAAIFHLFTHAFFKALLFLGAGAVIHALHHEQDMRRMGGIWRKIPFTYAMMWIGSLALAGIPFFAGFYSKDMILEAVYADHTPFGMYAFVLGLMSAGMTAFYSWRLLFMTFHGKANMPKKTLSDVHEAPWVMRIPLAVLAIGALFAGMLTYGWFVGDDRAVFWQSALFMLGEDIIEHAHHVPLWVKLSPLVMSAGGILLAWVFYIRRPDLPGRVVRQFRGVYEFLLHKWYFDELYQRIFVWPAFRAGRWFWQGIDVGVIDRFGPDGMAALSRRAAAAVSKVQTGYLYHYAFIMLAGVIVFIGYILLRGTL